MAESRPEDSQQQNGYPWCQCLHQVAPGLRLKQTKQNKKPGLALSLLPSELLLILSFFQKGPSHDTFLGNAVLL